MEYIGDELEVFERAHKWKKYYASFVKPYLKGAVLEVGAGLGGTTNFLCDDQQKEWTCLEPDKKLASLLRRKTGSGELSKCCKVITGTIADIPDAKYYNTIIYIDVIEHVENDLKELQLASEHLKRDGRLIVLTPSHNWLYSPFDQAIGHYRRYNKGSLKAVIPLNLELEKILYLDSIGLLLSSGNKFFLKQSNPQKEQILFWDNVIIPLSKVFDRLFFYNLGKSILGIWKKV
jgi:2-polyprenyl-3-methyl-5-hydroxy-6-metoxy-1,4-benzoquinol methylase